MGRSYKQISNWNSIRSIVFNTMNNHCNECGSTNRLEVDHIVNVAEGGSSDLSNLQLLCHECHDDKTKREIARGNRRKTGRREREQHPGYR